jgi:superfamily I DNA/RNA helicase
MKPSLYQKNIYKEYNTTNRNIVIRATAGSGKTTTLVELAKQTPMYKNSIFVAFNKSIAVELGKKLPKHVKAATMHSTGMTVITKYFKSFTKNKDLRLELKENKTFLILVKELELNKVFSNPKDRYRYLYQLCDLYDYYRINCLDERLPFIKLQAIADEYGSDWDMEMMTYFKDVLEIMNKKKDAFMKGNYNIIDFTDMIYFPKFIDDKFFVKNDVVMIDEGQDLNWLQKELIERLKKPTGKFVFVGDKFQMIYHFAGANINVFEAFENMPNTVSLPLSISYRCDKNIVSEARIVFGELSEIEARENAYDGCVREGNIDEVQPGEMVLCRNNAPLVDLWLKFLSRNKKAIIFGKDFLKGLEKSIEMLENTDNVAEAEEILYHNLELLRQRLKERGVKKPEYHQSFLKMAENITIFSVLMKYFDNGNSKNPVASAINILNEIFSDSVTEDKIVLMTVHKSKGLEAKKIYFYLPDLIPHRYCQNDAQLYAEHCLKFVGVTRAKNELVFIN